MVIGTGTARVVGSAILTVIPFFIFKGSQRISVICFITGQVAGVFAVRPVDDRFTFFDRFVAGMAFTGESGSDLSRVSRILCIISHRFMVLG